MLICLASDVVDKVEAVFEYLQEAGRRRRSAGKCTHLGRGRADGQADLSERFQSYSCALQTNGVTGCHISTVTTPNRIICYGNSR